MRRLLLPLALASALAAMGCGDTTGNVNGNLRNANSNTNTMPTVSPTMSPTPLSNLNTNRSNSNMNVNSNRGNSNTNATPTRSPGTNRNRIRGRYRILTARYKSLVTGVMTGHVRSSRQDVLCHPKRDHRDKPGDDGGCELREHRSHRANILRNGRRRATFAHSSLSVLLERIGSRLPRR